MHCLARYSHCPTSHYKPGTRQVVSANQWHWWVRGGAQRIEPRGGHGAPPVPSRSATRASTTTAFGSATVATSSTCTTHSTSRTTGLGMGSDDNVWLEGPCVMVQPAQTTVRGWSHKNDPETGAGSIHQPGRATVDRNHRGKAT